MRIRTAKFTDVVRDVSGGNAKLLQSAFQQAGSLAVVDQGQDFIAGFTDDESYRFRSETLPVIVFGDHTKAIKYIDFPFAMGADGVKVLKPTAECDAKYLYHYLRQARIPDAGYSRHFKFLKELDVPLPPLPEQRRIAAILDKADALRARRHEAIAKLDQLLQSVFLDMFGDPVTNPKGWPRRSLSNVGRVQTGGTPPSSMTDMFDGPVPFVTPGDLGGLVDLSRRTVTREGALLSRIAPAGSTLVCCIGATIGKMGFAKIDCAFNQQINSVTWNEDVLPKYGYYALRRLAPDISHRGASTTLPILKKSEFEKLLITVPPMLTQKKFSDAAEASEDQMRVFSENNERLDMLFLSLQADMFMSGAP